jgi:hypothetical protein
MVGTNALQVVSAIVVSNKIAACVVVGDVFVFRGSSRVISVI